MSDMGGVLIGELSSRPMVWTVLLLAIGLVPAISLASAPGLVRVSLGEAATIATRVATCAGVSCGLWLAVEHRWALRLLARRPRFALECCLLLGCGAASALVSCALNFVIHATQSYLAAGWCLWTETALALLLVQFRWRAPTAVFAFVALAWVLPAAVPAPATEHRGLDFAFRIAQDLSPAAASSDKTALNSLDLAPSAALLLMAWLLSRSGRR
jgi:hypothetical protein